MQPPSSLSPLFHFYGRTQEQRFLAVEMFFRLRWRKNVYLRTFGQWMKELSFCLEHVRCKECEEISGKSSVTRFFLSFQIHLGMGNYITFLILFYFFIIIFVVED